MPAKKKMGATVAEFLRGTWLIVTLDLRQRVRGLAWYVLLAVFVGLVTIVTALLWISTNAWEAGGGGIFSTIVFFVLLLGTLVSPALSGNAINGERDTGTLATTQVTLITTGQLVVGKFLAAWITALAFLAASVPFLVLAVALGHVSAVTISISILVLAAELGIIAAIGVGLSGVITRPLFSVVVTYLCVAALSIGTLIAFGLGGITLRSEVVNHTVPIDWQAMEEEYGPEWGEGDTLICGEETTYRYDTPRFDYVWGFLAANPYVVLADAVPPSWDRYGYPTDLFGWIAVGVRQTQHAPELEFSHNECVQRWDTSDNPSARETYEDSVPSWFVGLGIHVVLGAGALFWAYRRTDTPAGRLPAGARIA